MLERIFIKDYKNVKSNEVRTKYSYLANILSLIVNVVLAVSKIVVGVLFSSVAILADGINNMTDSGTITVSLVGTKISNRPADSKHPYGHRRIEYVSSLVISVVAILIAVELLGSSIERIVSPQATEYSIVMIVVLAVSIVLKLLIGLYNYRIAKKINSLNLKATAMDSLNDSIVTVAVLISTAVGMYTGVVLDAYTGIIVAFVILYSGIMLAKETMSVLLGEMPEDNIVEDFINKVKSYDGVKGVHDIQIHNYGPNKYFIILHVEVDSKVDIMVSHELIDTIESDLKTEDIDVVIHMDPIVTDDPVLEEYKVIENGFVKELDKRASLHDFRMVKGENRINLIFDIAMPFNNLKDEDIKQIMEKKSKEFDERLYTVINIDRF